MLICAVDLDEYRRMSDVERIAALEDALEDNNFFFSLKKDRYNMTWWYFVNFENEKLVISLLDLWGLEKQGFIIVHVKPLEYKEMWLLDLGR